MMKWQCQKCKIYRLNTIVKNGKTTKIRPKLMNTHEMCLMHKIFLNFFRFFCIHLFTRCHCCDWQIGLHLKLWKRSEFEWLHWWSQLHKKERAHMCKQWMTNGTKSNMHIWQRMHCMFCNNCIVREKFCLSNVSSCCMQMCHWLLHSCVWLNINL